MLNAKNCMLGLDSAEDYLLNLIHLKLLEMERKGRPFELGQGREL